MLTGEHRSIFRGRGMEFDQVVRFGFGDDIRDVDWNVTARLGDIYRKIFVEDRELSVAIVFSDHPALHFGSGTRSKRDVLLELAALLMLLSAMNRERVMLIHQAPDDIRTFPSVRERSRILAIASGLFAADPPDPLGSSGHCSPIVRENIPRGALVIWLGEVPDAPPPPEWGRWMRLHHVIGMRVEDPWERDGPAHEPLTVYDPMTGRLAWLRDNATTREKHTAWRAAREARWRAWWPDPADRLTVDMDGDPLEALALFLRAREKRGPVRGYR